MPAGRNMNKIKHDDDACVFVGNMAFTTTWQRLKDTFRKAGDVRLVELVVDGNNKPKGSALVTFTNAADADKAVQELNGVVIDGRDLLVRKFEKGSRPSVAQGNYTKEQLSRVNALKGTHGGAAGDASKAHQGGGQQGGKQGGDRVSLRLGGNDGDWKVNDGGDFNRRNAETFGSDAQNYNQQRKKHGAPTGQFQRQEPAMPAPASRAGGDQSVSRRKLFISNLPYTCSWKLLKDTFSQVGNVVRADVMMDEKGRSRGMGTVIFSSADEAQTAIQEFHNIAMDGRPMGVRLDRDYSS